MAVRPNSFARFFNHTRGTGATRISPTTGFIVGVDFSTTSNTIGTGSKTFTLTADANVNREWTVGENVLVTSQAGATGTMTGVVTSYTASTQVLVVNVPVGGTTGSGTSTDWRIGSLEVRRTGDGLIVEQQTAAMLVRSEQFDNASWTKSNATATANQFTGADGSLSADTLAATAANGTITQNYTAVAGTYTFSVWLARKTGSGAVQLTVDGNYTTFNIDAILRRYSVTATVSAGTRTSGIRITTLGDEVYAFGGQVTLTSDAVSYIPTTTVSWTRNADTVTFNSTALQSVRQGQGVIYVDAVGEGAAVVASGSNGKKISIPFINKVPFAAYNKARFLLNQFPAAAVAYSTRQLNANAPFALRVRRSNDNAQQDIGFDSLGNLDEAALTAFVGSNSAFVTTWYDQSGNARHATQTTAANQPRIVNAGVVDKVNGRGSVKFDNLLFLRNSALTLTDPTTSTFSVAVKDGIGGTALANSRIVSLAGSGNDAQSGSQIPGLFGTGSLFSATPPDVGAFSVSARGFNKYTYGQLSQLSSLFTPTSHTHYRNGAAGTTVSATNTLNSTLLQLGYGQGQADGYLNGNISEVILYASDQSANRTAIEQNIMSYFGITG